MKKGCESQAVGIMDEKAYEALLEKALAAEKADKVARAATKLLFMRLACAAGFRASLSGKDDQAQKLLAAAKKSSYLAICQVYITACAGGYTITDAGLKTDLALSCLSLDDRLGVVLRKGIGRAEKRAIVSRAADLKARNPLSFTLAKSKREKILDKKYLVKTFDEINKAVSGGLYLPEIEKQLYQLRQDLIKILETL